MPLNDLLHQNVIGLALPELLNAVQANADPALLLPAIQRGSVWTPKKIVDVWDSVLRGMPIGGFLVYRLGEDVEALRVVANQDGGRIMPADGRMRFALLDGQQRLKALMHGWLVEEGRSDLCLWIDLGKSTPPSSFALRVTTVGQPYGYDKTNKSRLSESLRREARRSFLLRGGIPDAEVDTFNFSDLHFFNISHVQPEQWAEHLVWERPTPFEASPWTLPLAKLIAICRNGLEQPLNVIFRDGPHLSNDAEAAFEAFRQAVCYSETYRISVQCVPDQVVNEVGEGGLATLFQRIGQSGEQLSPSDLIFSSIKHRYPYAHDVVHDIWFGTGRRQIAWTDSRWSLAESNGHRAG